MTRRWPADRDTPETYEICLLTGCTGSTPEPGFSPEICGSAAPRDVRLPNARTGTTAHATLSGLPYDVVLVSEKVVQPGVVTVPRRSAPPLLGGGPLRSTISYPAAWWIQWPEVRRIPLAESVPVMV